eukprot:COSAG02_NODE_4512_length_5277_cov_2.807455_4_plen_222_part_00
MDSRALVATAAAGAATVGAIMYGLGASPPVRNIGSPPAQLQVSDAAQEHTDGLRQVQTAAAVRGPSDELHAMSAELQDLRLKQLLGRARAKGVGGKALEDALDTDDPREVLIKLLMIKSEPCAAVPDELMTELREMKLMALQRRALCAGIAGSAVEDAMECADPKAAVIGLVVEAEARRGPSARALSCVEAGGAASVEMITSALELSPPLCAAELNRDLTS